MSTISKKDIVKREAQTPTEIERTQNRQVFIPEVDIYEKDNLTILLADMPGVNEKSVDINLEKNVLTIRGRVSTNQDEAYKTVYSEYGLGDYERVFTLSSEIDINKIEASIKDGVLKLTLPKAEAARPKKIAVKAA